MNFHVFLDRLTGREEGIEDRWPHRCGRPFAARSRRIPGAACDPFSSSDSTRSRTPHRPRRSAC
jgi:hypothetical protein